MNKQNKLLSAALCLAFSVTGHANDLLSQLPKTNPNEPVKEVRTSANLSAAPALSGGTATSTLPPLPNIPEKKTKQEIKDDAFKATKDAIAPMSPEMILQFRKFIDEQQRAKAATPDNPAKPVITTMSASLDPGVTPPVVRLAGGFVSSLVFVDSTGAEWPVVKFISGNDEIFHAEQPVPSSNVITISTISAYGHGNLFVYLKDNPTPLMITLVSGQKQVDYRADIHIQKRGPNAVTQISKSDSGLKLSQPLSMVLDGIPPTNGKPMTFDGKPNQAWKVDGKTYIRTDMTLLSPGWLEHVSSPSGINAYVIQDTPVLLMSNARGETQQVQVKE